MKPWILLFITGSAFGQQADITNRTGQFVQHLSPALREKAQYKFDDAERFNWHFVPRSRNGVSLRDLSADQRTAVFGLLKVSLSEQGYRKATSIVDHENILREVEGRNSDDRYRDPLNYYVTVFGQPGASGVWAWRFEGHHVALNFTTINDRLESSTPSFFGSNPAIVKNGPERGKQILSEESNRGFDLINALDPDQLKKAMIAEQALPDIVSFNSRKAEPVTPAGISYRELSDKQQKMLLTLLDVYVNNYTLGFSKKLMAKIQKAGVDNLSFAWAGSTKEGAAYYYRIQGPMLLIELDNTQNNANHVHSVVRDLTNDFADDILKEHYQKEHNPK
ncbi:DUF3500 domain-containing protein [Chryseolinea sp. T2]|uniref:DUF3500 domain-containing protein n=1 Tax=Chryseolinea sp. T2 TaxID=3129255 RepID=UPI0030776521